MSVVLEFCKSVLSNVRRTFSVRAVAFLLLLTVLHSPAYAVGSLSRFTHLGTRDGLSDDNISSIYQDEFGVIWIGTSDGLNRYDGKKVHVFRPGINDSTTIYNNNVKRVCGDRNGKIYVLSKFAVNEYDIATEKFRLIRKSGMRHICCNRGNLWAASQHSLYRLKDGSLEKWLSLGSGRSITALTELSDGRILVGTDTDGALVIDANKKILSLLPEVYVSHLYEDSRHNIYVATRYSGLYRISSANAMTHFTHTADENSINDDYVRCVCEDVYGNCWIGTFNGLCVLNPNTGKIRRVDKGNMSASSIWDIISDNEGSVWIGSHYGGVNVWSKEQDAFESYEFYGKMVEDEKGGLYIGSEDEQLLYYDVRDGRLSTVGNIGEYGLKSLYYDLSDRTLWIGTLRAGLLSKDSRGRIKRYPVDPSDPEAIQSDYIHTIVPYGADSLIVATRRGIVMFDKASGRCRRLFEGTKAERKYVTDVIVDDDGDCWTVLSGSVCRVNLKTGEAKEYFTDGSVPELGTSNIQTLFQDREGRIWLGSNGRGLFLYNNDESFTCINSSNSALPSDYITAISQSPSGYLLISTNAGLSRYDCDNGIFFNYNYDNGYPIPDANAYGILVASDRRIYLSGFGHTVSFYENDLACRSKKSDIWFVSLTVNNHRVSPGDESGILQKSLFYQDRIVLGPSHNMFSVECSPIEYLSDASRSFEYRLVGFDEEWVHGKWDQPLTYTNLPPRDYVLETKLTDRQTGEELARKNLRITVKPQFYQTVWFYLLVLLAASLTIFVCIRAYAAHLRLNSSLEYEKKEKNRIQELNDAKMRFFTYISHEIRTPVTLMTSSTDYLLSQQGLSPIVYSRLKGLRENLDKVTKLINELLDFRKHESDMSNLKFSFNDLVLHLAKVEANFREYALQKRIDFGFDNMSGSRELFVWYDYDQMDKVLTNLLSNAFKYAEGKISIVLEQDESMAIVRVCDDGEGIAPMYQKVIFEPFGQVPDSGKEVLGTGLGLALSQKIVAAHKGILKVNSDVEKGATFTVKLLKGESHIPVDSRCERVDEDYASLQAADTAVDDAFVEEICSSRAKAGIDKVKMLIVEDNDDLRHSLANLMEPFFNIYLASDGHDALQKMEKSMPDIILSDLMMPNIDGNELCYMVKSNVETSHIPFVMLTAKVSADAELEGFINGADDYISKPFNAKVLISKCNNIVMSRAMLQRRFRRSLNVNPEEFDSWTQLDKDFIEKSQHVIEAHLSDPEFDINMFAHEMAMGRTNFFMKIKGITGQTPNKFISNMRLKKSVELMNSNPSLSVSEVAYMVGFSSPSYFIKQFRELFGTTPSLYKSESNTKSESKPLV